MGVMSCSRMGCDSVMCDTHVDSVGYVCYECQTEFKKYLSQQNISINTENDIFLRLSMFMQSYKGDFNENTDQASVDSFFTRYTR